MTSMNKKMVKKAVAIFILALGFIQTSATLVADAEIPPCLPCPRGDKKG